MATPRKSSSSTKRAVTPTLAENHTPSEAIAFGIRSDRIDLAPSVQRIVNAGLNEQGTFQALTLFRDSLTSPGDPNRDPAVAIEAGRKLAARS